jgi:ubiquinone biosynthesis protein
MSKNLPFIRLGKAYPYMRRYRQILKILVRHGFGSILERLKIEAYLRIPPSTLSKLKGKRLIRIKEAERVRMALEELGPTFIKLGQVLSLRPDLVPVGFVKEFRKLQDQGPPFGFEQVEELIEGELGGKMEGIFKQFNPVPSASASLSQVHSGVTLEGEEVVVKVQRPRIKEVVEADLEILYNLAQQAGRKMAELRPYDPVGIVEEFSKSIRRVLDFAAEGRNIERFAHNFRDDPTVYVPGVFWKLTASKVLTVERIRGIKVSQVEELKEAGLDPGQIAVSLVQAILRQIFEYGFFHAALHPANILVLKGNIIAPLHYGMMGHLNEEMREELGVLLAAVISGDVKKIVKLLLKMGVVVYETDTRRLEWEVEDLLDRYFGVPPGQLNMAKILDEVFPLLNRHRIRLLWDFALIGQALATAEDAGKGLDSEFNILPLIRSYIKKLMLKRMGLKRRLKVLRGLWEDLSDLFTHLPGDLRQMLAKTKRGELIVKLEHHGLEHLTSVLDKSSNRLSFSLIIAALIIGSSLVMQLNKGPQLLGFPAFGALGFLIAGILGLWLVVAILRSGRL